MATTLVNSGLGYGYWLVVARVFAPAEVGLATGLIALMTITSLASNLGTASALVQRLPSRRSVEEWSTTLSASLVGGAVLGVAAALGVLVALPVLAHSLSVVVRHSPVLAMLFVVGTAFWTVSTVLDYTFIAQRSSHSMTTRNAIFGVVKIPFVIVAPLVVGIGAGVTTIFASWVIACIVSCALAIRLVIPSLRPGARLRLAGIITELKNMTRILAGNYLITLGNILPSYLLPVVVVSRLSPTENAYFYITWLVGGIFFMVSSSVGSSLFAEGSHTPSALHRHLISSMRMTTILLVPAMLLMVIAGYWILAVFGARYAHAGIALLLILTAAAIPDAITNLYVAVLRVQTRLRTAALLTCAMALIAVVGGWIVAPSYGLAGIGVVWLTSQALGSAWVGWDNMHSLRARTRCDMPKGVSISG